MWNHRSKSDKASPIGKGLAVQKSRSGGYCHSTRSHDLWTRSCSVTCNASSQWRRRRAICYGDHFWTV